MTALDKLASSIRAMRGFERTLRSLGRCPRCLRIAPLLWHVKSDIVDHVVCAECAEAAKRVGLDVTVTNQ